MSDAPERGPGPEGSRDRLADLSARRAEQDRAQLDGERLMSADLERQVAKEVAQAILKDRRKRSGGFWSTISLWAFAVAAIGVVGIKAARDTFDPGLSIGGATRPNMPLTPMDLQATADKGLVILGYAEVVMAVLTVLAIYLCLVAGGYIGAPWITDYLVKPVHRLRDRLLGAPAATVDGPLKEDAAPAAEQPHE